MVNAEWVSYRQGFSRASEPWPPLPLPVAPELAWWEGLIATGLDGALQGHPVLEALNHALPQLRLPQQAGISSSELYKALVLRGESPDAASIAAMGKTPEWHSPEALRLWIAPHPCGALPVIQTPSWHDFVQLVRALGHRGEPVELADGIHAQAVSGLIHWGLIQTCGRQSRARLILLHEAPYGSVPASAVPGDLTNDAWLAASTTLRLEHELTHLATKRLLGEMRLNLLDELIADCMGMVAALGEFNAELFGRCLGMGSGTGRWSAYTTSLNTIDTGQACELVMLRAYDLECCFNQQPELLRPEQAMARLRWLCHQRLDQTILIPIQENSAV